MKPSHWRVHCFGSAKLSMHAISVHKAPFSVQPQLLQPSIERLDTGRVARVALAGVRVLLAAVLRARRGDALLRLVDAGLANGARLRVARALWRRHDRHTLALASGLVLLAARADAALGALGLLAADARAAAALAVVLGQEAVAVADALLRVVRERDARALGARGATVAVARALIAAVEYDLTPGVLHVKQVLVGGAHCVALMHWFFSHTSSSPHRKPAPQHEPPARRQIGVPSAAPSGNLHRRQRLARVVLAGEAASALLRGVAQPHACFLSQRYCGHGKVKHCLGSSVQISLAPHGFDAQALVLGFSQRYCGHGVVTHCFGSSMQVSPLAQGLSAHEFFGGTTATHSGLPAEFTEHLEPTPHLEHWVFSPPMQRQTPQTPSSCDRAPSHCIWHDLGSGSTAAQARSVQMAESVFWHEQLLQPSK
jgi:hypothetical protein